MKKWRLLGIVLVAFIVGVVGCPETQQMMKPVVDEVTEPRDTTPPPVTVGGMKQDEEPGEPNDRTEPEEPSEVVEAPGESTEPKTPADTTPPTVVEVSWYGNEQMTQSLTADSTVHPGDTVYTVVRFSEPVRHVVADDNTSRPALLIVVDGKTRRYQILPHGVDIQSGEAQSLHGDNTDYLCKYTIPADTVGTIALRVGGSTADTAGNRVTDASVHTALFSITESEPEQITLTLPPGYTLPPELIPTEPTVLSADEQVLIQADELIIIDGSSYDGTAVHQYTTDSPVDVISLLPYKDREEVYDLFVAAINLPSFTEAAEKMKEINITLRILGGKARETGNRDEYRAYKQQAEKEQGFLGLADLDPLVDIYFEENPQHLQHKGTGHSMYWIILEYYRLQLENPELPNLFWKNRPLVEAKEIQDLFRQSARKGYIFGLDNPWS